MRRELTENGFLLRYRPDAAGGVDGLPGGEGVFPACTFWLADALAGLRRHDDAEQVFTRLLDLRNDLGLLSEEYDVAARRQLGNTPQAFRGDRRRARHPVVGAVPLPCAGAPGIPEEG
ncbi:hypothetical protein ACWKWC_00750 [Geodermatophilus nigrescens]